MYMHKVVSKQQDLHDTEQEMYCGTNDHKSSYPPVAVAPTKYVLQQIRNKTTGRMPKRSKVSWRAHHHLARTVLGTVDLEGTAEGGGVRQAKNGAQRCRAARLRGR